ncbi:MAG: copper resistance protein CopC [Gemmatimonas sp.]
MRRILTAATGALALTLTLTAYAGEARAHASLVTATPAADAVAAAPREVMLTFTERLDPSFSTVEVRAASGERVDRQDVRVDAADARCLRVSLPALPPGVYRVIWKSVAVDMHVKTGEFVFHVAP